MIWLTHKMKDTSVEKVRHIAHSKILDNPEKCLVVSALTLSLLDYFDPRKILLLVEFISEHELEVYQRALTGLGLVLIWYDRRISFYPEIMVRLDESPHSTEKLVNSEVQFGGEIPVADQVDENIVGRRHVARPQFSPPTSGRKPAR